MDQPRPPDGLTLLQFRSRDPSPGILVAKPYPPRVRVPVAMVTAVRPDFDIVSLGFDAYIEKPVDMTEVRALVDSLLRLREYESSVREYFELISKLAALESEFPQAVLRDNEDYRTLVERFAAVKAGAREPIDRLMAAGRFDALVRRLDG